MPHCAIELSQIPVSTLIYADKLETHIVYADAMVTTTVARLFVWEAVFRLSHAMFI